MGIPKYHKQLWDYHRMTEPASEQVVNAGRRHYDTFSDLGDKVFSTLFSGQVAESVAEPKPGSEWVEKAYKGMGLGDSQITMQRTKGNDWWSGIGATTFLSEFLENVEPPTAPIEDPTKDEQIAEYLRRLAEKQDDPELIEKINAEARERQEAADAKKANAAQQAALMDETEIRNASRAAAQATSSKLNEIQQAMDGMGLGAGDGTHSGRKARTEVAKKLSGICSRNEDFAKVMEIAGRLRRIADAQQRHKPNKGSGEVTGVESGNNLPRLLASQLMDSFDEEREPLFFAKYQKRALLQYEKTQKEDEGRGPVVLVVDTSGSMRSGDSHIWAQAVTLAYLDICRKQKRDFGIVHFASTVVGQKLLKHSDLKDIDKIVDAVSFAPSGGTTFMEPLDDALRLVKNEGDFKKADIVMVTDGHAEVGAEWLSRFNAARREMNTAVYSILVGNSCNIEVNKRFSDEVVHLAQTLRDDKAMHHLFAKI